LPRVLGFAEGFLKSLPRARSAQQYSRHCILCRGSGRRQDGALGIINSLPSASPRQGAHRQRRSKRRHIWAAVHCADGFAVRPSAQMLPMPSAPSPALGKGVDPGLPRLTGLCREWGRRQSACLCRRPTLGTSTFAEGPARLSAKK
jgi:hypothetical protein